MESIKSLLQILQVRAGIAISCTNSEENKRKWLFMEHDGGIVNPTLRLIFNTSEAAQQLFNWIVPQMELLHLEYQCPSNLCREYVRGVRYIDYRLLDRYKFISLL